MSNEHATQFGVLNTVSLITNDPPCKDCMSPIHNGTALKALPYQEWMRDPCFKYKNLFF